MRLQGGEMFLGSDSHEWVTDVLQNSNTTVAAVIKKYGVSFHSHQKWINSSDKYLSYNFSFSSNPNPSKPIQNFSFSVCFLFSFDVNKIKGKKKTTLQVKIH